MPEKRALGRRLTIPLRPQHSTRVKFFRCDERIIFCATRESPVFMRVGATVAPNSAGAAAPRGCARGMLFSHMAAIVAALAAGGDKLRPYGRNTIRHGAMVFLNVGAELVSARPRFFPRGFSRTGTHACPLLRDPPRKTWTGMSACPTALGATAAPYGTSRTNGVACAVADWIHFNAVTHCGPETFSLRRARRSPRRDEVSEL
jgi:hypothetical protein